MDMLFGTVTSELAVLQQQVQDEKILLLQVSAELEYGTEGRLRQDVKLEEPMETARAEKNRFQTITAILSGSKWNCLLLRIVPQETLGEVVKVYPPMKLKVSVDYITACLEERNKEHREVAEKVLKVMRWKSRKRV